MRDMRGSTGAGHAKNMRGERVDLLYGNGCKNYHDCFSCPLPDCNWNSGSLRGSMTSMKHSTLDNESGNVYNG